MASTLNTDALTMRSGGTTAESEAVLPEQWQENFRMLRTSFLALCELLRPHIEGLTTEMRLRFLHLRVDGDIFFKIARVDRIDFQPKPEQFQWLQQSPTL